MPQLLSRMDDINWLTPSIADILEQGPPPPGGDGSIREHILWLQEQLSEKETPARVINVRPTPSYTLFIVRLEPSRGRRKVTLNDVKRSLGQIAEERKTWRFGFIPTLTDVPEAFGILLRTEQHKSLSLRRLLVRTTFRDHTSSMAFAVGNSLEQRLIVEDLAEIGNLLIVGDDASKKHFLMSVLITLITLNTPGEIRLVLAGQSANQLSPLIDTPHTLGRLLYSPPEATSLFEGLGKELGRRRAWMQDENVDNIAAYNLILKDKGQTRIPRIVIALDSISDEDWMEAPETWQDALINVLKDGGKSGIHVIGTMGSMEHNEIFSEITMHFPQRVLTRTEAAPLLNNLDNFHGSLLRFIDAAYFNGNKQGIPVEFCAISNEEVQNTITYWQHIAGQRYQESTRAPVSGRTGVTSMLSEPVSVASDEDQRLLELDDGPVPIGDTDIPDTKPSISLNQAQALATYLGWIGIGPLQDILGMSQDEAMRTVTVLKTMGIVEDNASHTPRFVRPISQRED